MVLTTVGYSEKVPHTWAGQVNHFLHLLSPGRNISGLNIELKGLEQFGTLKSKCRDLLDLKNTDTILDILHTIMSLLLTQNSFDLLDI